MEENISESVEEGHGLYAKKSKTSDSSVKLGNYATESKPTSTDHVGGMYEFRFS